MYWLLRHIYVLAHKINSKSKFLAEIMHWRFPWTHCSTFLDISKILTIFSKIQFYTTIFSQNWISRRVLKSSQSLLSENTPGQWTKCKHVIKNQVWIKKMCLLKPFFYFEGILCRYSCFKLDSWCYFLKAGIVSFSKLSLISIFDWKL